MKLVTEFSFLKLDQGAKLIAEQTAASKTPEETLAALGEKFKLEGEKLTHFSNSIEACKALAAEKIARILVVTYAEGENVPPKATKIGEHHFVPEFFSAPKAANTEAKSSRDGGGGGQRKGGNKGPKPSPWGISPEEKEAKLEASKRAAKAAKTPAT